MRFRLVLLAAVLCGCSSLHPISAAPTPVALTEYLRTHQRPALMITDTTGRTRWVYDARMSGDTLRGLRTTDRFSEPIVIPIGQVSGAAAQEFSAIRTLGLAGVVFTVLAFIALTMPRAVY